MPLVSISSFLFVKIILNENGFFCLLWDYSFLAIAIVRMKRSFKILKAQLSNLQIMDLNYLHILSFLQITIDLLC